MGYEEKQHLAGRIRQFRLPRYHEIPDIGLYLEQVTQYISNTLAPLWEGSLTNSMVSNYVKKGLLQKPQKKLYSREQIAYLFFITVAKNVLSLDYINAFIALQRQTYESEQAYDYFCDELENMLTFIFGLKEKPEEIGNESTEEKFMLRNLIIAVSHKIYLEKIFQERWNKH